MKNHNFTIPIVHEKKVLALVLAFACAFTMFAGAAFTDAADVSQTEAVDMLTALGVIDGYEDGSFRPDATVTRAEMAKMIYVIRNGGSDVVTQYEGYKTPFTDVENVNHWAKGYIAYCYANGIISGKSATSFDPDATVTGTEAAKMALVLLGYDPTKAGLEGSAWATNTINLATKKDLFQNYGISISGGCDRQYAAQLLYNTLWAGTVRWSNDANGYEDVVDYNKDNNGVVVGLAYVTVAKKYMGLEETIVTYKGDSKVNTGLTAGQSMVGANTIITFVPENGNEWLGESVKVLFKNSKDGPTAGLDKYDTIYGMTLSGETSTVEAVLGDIGDHDTTTGKIKVNDVKYSLAGNINVYRNLDDVAFTTINGAAAFDTALKKNSADTIKLVLNDKGDVKSVYVNHVDFYQVTGLTSTKISLAGLGTIDIDDKLSLDENVAVNDIVALTTLYANAYNSDDAYNVIEKAEIVSGVTVTNVKNMTATGDKQVLIDGAYAKYADINNQLTRSDSNYKDIVELDGTYDFVMYDGYWVAAKKISASSKDIALITKTSTGGINDEVKVLKGDGTEAVYVYDDADDKGADYGYLGDAVSNPVGNAVGTTDRLYSFSLVGDSKIQLKNGTMTYNTPGDSTSGMDDQNGGEAVTGLRFLSVDSAIGDSSTTSKFYNADNKTVYVDSDSYVVDEDAAIFVYAKDKNSNYVYNINDLKTIYVSDVYDDVKNIEYVLNDDDEVVALYVETNNKPGAATTNEQYGYVIDDVQASKVDGTEYREFSVWTGTETVTVKVETSSTPSGVQKGAFVKFIPGTNGVTDTNDLDVLKTGNIAAVSAYDANRGILTLYKNAADTVNGGTNTYKVADDVVIIGVNTKDKKLVEGVSTVTKAFIDANGATKPATENIVYVLNSDKEVVAIFVDTNNKVENPSTAQVLPTGSRVDAE